MLGTYPGSAPRIRRSVRTVDPVLVDVIAGVVFVAYCIVMGVYGADSRPGFSDGRTDVKERFSFHSKHD